MSYFLRLFIILKSDHIERAMVKAIVIMASGTFVCAMDSRSIIFRINKQVINNIKYLFIIINFRRLD